jgi:hypothetical protein
MDAYWHAVSEFLHSNGVVDRAIVAPSEFRGRIALWKNYTEAVAEDGRKADVLVLHKGRFRELDPGLVNSALSRLYPSFANEVFIVLTSDCATLERTDPHLSPLAEISAWAARRAADPAPVAHCAGNGVDVVLRQIALSRWFDALRATDRARQALRLTRYGAKTFSQNDEDGILGEIFRRIGMRDRVCVEFGVESGQQCNTALLIAAGWRGLWMDSVSENIKAARANHAQAIAEGRLKIVQASVTAENINSLIEEGLGDYRHAVDLLSIDIDGNDYWVWKAISVIRPRVVAIEYNASFPPPLDFLAPYRPDESWDLTSYYGASLTVLERLGRTKGYSLVGCCLAGVNAFFVRDDELNSREDKPQFHSPFTAAEHFEPVRYALCDLPAGHRPGFGLNVAEAELQVLAAPELTP